MKKISTSVKSLLSMAAVALLGSSFGALSAKAQLTSGNAIVTVTLVDVMALAVTEPAVPLTYSSITDYQVGRNISIPLHLTVSSNRPYDIKVKAADDLKNTLNASQTIPISNISVQVDGTTGVGTTSTLNLSTTDQTLASNAPGAMAKIVGVKYSTPANSNDFINTGIYTATLTYSISAH
ncbi:hypothetical protein [Spirosoma gilvum]